ncbi:MAG: DUF58 domain-containing protein [Lentisphaeraceae bacterium]|nr:DUF58 domain-containing protein [Lentisphaeraceae bacterium]
MKGDNKATILDLEEVSKLDNLLVFAKSIVDGYFSGRHKAINYGCSAQFKDYKAYQPGDDITNIDWSLYGRTKKLYTKHYDNETDMVVYLIVDMSAPMGYGDKSSKCLLASRIAAALSYLMINQGDKVSLVLFDTKINSFTAPGGTRKHLYSLVDQLETSRPSLKTDLCAALEQCQGLFKKRGRLVILSDFWGQDSKLFDTLSLFLHQKYEILLMQIIDDDELKLPEYDNICFVDMESGEEIQIEPGEIRKQYQKNMQSFLDNLSSQSESRKIKYSLINTKNPYIEAIESYLGFRKES